MKNLILILAGFFLLICACGNKKEMNNADNEAVMEAAAEVTAIEELTVVLDSTQLLILEKEKELDALLNEIDF